MSGLTSWERIGLAMRGEEPDRVPFFLPVTLHGARAVGVPLRDYLSRPADAVEGQLRLRARFGHDMVYGFLHASAEVEAFGGESLRYDDGPPNGGEPPVRPDTIRSLQPPRPEEVPALRRALELIRGLSARVAGQCPVVGVVVSPFSLPAMQLGLTTWIELIYEQPELAERLIQVNEAFTVAWANAQVAAGAAPLVFFDPVASPDLVPSAVYLGLARPSMRRCLAAIRAPAVVAYASARDLARVPDAADAGAVGITGSPFEPLADLKAACGARLTVLGGLDSIALAGSTPAQAAAAARAAMAAVGRGGRYVLCEHHGEIPWQVSEEVLDAVAAAVHEHGRYPLPDPAAPRA